MEFKKNYFIYPNGKIYGRKRQIYMPEKKDKKGFHYVKLEGILYYNHLLVVKYYKINFHSYPVLLHRDGNKANNRLENLQYTFGTRYDERVKRHKCISYLKRDNHYIYKKIIKGVQYTKNFKTLKEALCYKYIFILKMRAGLI